MKYIELAIDTVNERSIISFLAESCPEKLEARHCDQSQCVWRPFLSFGRTTLFFFDYGYQFRLVIPDDEDKSTTSDAKDITPESKTLTLPEPPEGEEWHNPDNLTAAQFALGDEYLPLTVRQRQLRSGSLYIPEIERWFCWKWDSSGWNGDNKKGTYRIKKSAIPKIFPTEEFNEETPYRLLKCERCGDSLECHHHDDGSAYFLCKDGGRFSTRKESVKPKIDINE